MNTKSISALVALALLSLPAAGQVYPWLYYGQDLDGTPLTNALTIEAWPQTNTITGVGTNLVVSFAKTYLPDTNGYYSNNLAPGNYRLSVAGLTRGVTFGIVATNTSQNLAQAAGVPVVTFLNYTLAQFSDAGTAAYSNTAAFFLVSAAGTAAYSNTAAFFLASAAGTAAYSNTAAFALASHDQTLATITNAGTAAYSNTAAFLTPAQIGTAAYSNTTAFLWSAGLATNSGIVWLSTNLATGVAPDAVLPNGSILTGTNGSFYVRTNGAWVEK